MTNEFISAFIGALITGLVVIALWMSNMQTINNECVKGVPRVIHKKVYVCVELELRGVGQPISPAKIKEKHNENISIHRR